MTTEVLIDMIRDSLLTALTLATPPLLVALVIGVVFGALQAVTQIHDPAISLVPRLVAILFTLVVCLPWLIESLLVFSQRYFSDLLMFGSGG